VVPGPEPDHDIITYADKPILSSTLQQTYAQEAGEFLRKEIIGTHVKIRTDKGGNI
jgi:hypothetical protein